MNENTIYQQIYQMAGTSEILDQLCEECAELIQAAQKVRRTIAHTTPVPYETALRNLTEECADVQLLIDILAEGNLVNVDDSVRIYHAKLGRWKERLNPMIRLEQLDRTAILEAAKARVCGDRNLTHGEPENSFAMIADLWDIFIKQRYLKEGDDWTLSPRDVCLMMDLLKIAREVCGQSHPDNYIDIAGYAACAAELAD